jgi:hypothetical protein
VLVHNSLSVISTECEIDRPTLSISFFNLGLSFDMRTGVSSAGYLTNACQAYSFPNTSRSAMLMCFQQEQTSYEDTAVFREIRASRSNTNNAFLASFHELDGG